MHQGAFPADLTQMVTSQRGSHSLAEVVRFVIATLVKWAQIGQYGEIRIVVQGGQIEFVHEAVSYRGTLPRRGGQAGAEAADKLAEQVTGQQ